MEVQDHITQAFYWRRCKRIVFDGETATWELDQKRYDVFRAYQKAPHRQLIQANDDISLRAFVKAWGPLTSVLATDEESITEETKGSDSIRDYRHEQHKLDWMVRLFASIEDSDTEKQRAILSEFSELRKEDRDLIRLRQIQFSDALARKLNLLGFGDGERIGAPRIEMPGLVLKGPNENTREWVETAKARDVETVCIHLINRITPSNRLEYAVERTKGRNFIKAVSTVGNLAEALHWMVWQDVFQRNPIRFCRECNELIKHTTRHDKTFCNPVCARRKTAREWQQRKREKERSASGTQEAR